MADESKPSLFSSLDSILATMARLFATEGAAREVAILANAQASFQHLETDWGVDFYRLYLRVPSALYAQIVGDVESSEASIHGKAKLITRPFHDEEIRDISIIPLIEAVTDWRDKAKSWLAGEGITNQVRVRSNNIPSKTADGLLFRSQNEIFLYKIKH